MRSALRGLEVVLVVLAAACGDDSEGGTGLDDNITGTYTLRTINGSPPPVTVAQDGSGRIEITGATLTLNGNNTFTDVTSFRLVTSSASSTDQATMSGSYTQTGNNIVFTTTDGGVYSMAVQGNTLIQAEEGFTFIFQR